MGHITSLYDIYANVTHITICKKYLLAVTKQTEGQQLGLLPVGGSHVVFAVSLLEGLTDPDPPELAHQGVLPCQPTFIILHDDADDLRKEDEQRVKQFTYENEESHHPDL